MSASFYRHSTLWQLLSKSCSKPRDFFLKETINFSKFIPDIQRISSTANPFAIQGNPTGSAAILKIKISSWVNRLNLCISAYLFPSS